MQEPFWPEYGFFVVEKVIFTEKLIDTVKYQFFKVFRAIGKRDTGR